MKVDVEVSGELMSVDMQEGGTCMDLVRARGLRPDVTIVLLGGKPVPIDSPLETGPYSLVQVASGG